MALRGALGDRDFRVGGSALAVIMAIETLVMCLAVISQGSGTRLCDRALCTSGLARRWDRVMIMALPRRIVLTSSVRRGKHAIRQWPRFESKA